jgi:Xaa-Pro aminopeptidase
MSQIPNRLELLRERMRSVAHSRGVGVDAYIVPSADAHQSEYLPSRWKRREFITGFDGSAGDAVVALESAGLWTDGRYWLQASEQLNGTGVDLFKAGAQGVPSWQAWLAKFPDGSTVGVDPRTLTNGVFESLRNDLGRRGVALVALDENLIDEVWSDQPAMPSAPIRVHPPEFAGKSVADKLADLRAELAKHGATAHPVTSLDAIAWLFNLRGADVECNPVFVAYAIVTTDDATLFVDASRMTPDAKRSLQGVAKVAPYGEFERAMRDLASKGAKFWIDEHASSAWVFSLGGDRVVERSRGPVFLAKGVKNESELMGMREAHRRDGASMVRFLKWLEEAVPLGGQTELSVSRTLQAQRSSDERSIGVAFDSIVGYGAHGAIIHYRPTEESASPVSTSEVLLIDSGGQYLDGTTDITRTVHLGEPTSEHRARFTAVLKAHIALAMQRFPRGAKGVALDAVCRSVMWAHGLDFQHGTGHGVGAAMNVHEEPPRINATPTGFFPLHPGMIFSNEPGFYAEGRFGIRIENLEEIVRDERPVEGDTEFLCLRPLTLCPIQLKMIDASMLTDNESEWLDSYHARVREELTPLLDEEHASWLAEQTRPLREYAGA